MLSSIVALLAATIAVTDPKPRSPLTLFVILTLTHFTGAFQLRKRERETDVD